MPKTTTIDLSAVDAIRTALANRPHIGIDTEFMRERTFYSQLCLLQVATGDDILCIDPLGDQNAGDARAAWTHLLSLPWILHSARQDIEVVWQSAGSMPVAVFDTQIAAGLLGYQPQIGYANLVADLFDIKLEKSHTRADWSKRPLAAEYIEYAAEDVLYLLPAHQNLAERLERLGRLEWAQQDSADLLLTALYEPNPAHAIDRIKGATNLRGGARNVAARLARWREEEAQRSDRPRQWIVQDKVLLDIAVRQPRTADELAAIDGLSGRTVQRACGELLAAIQKGLADENRYEPPERPDDAQKQMLKTLQQLVLDCAQDLGIAAEIVAPKKELSLAVAGSRDSRIFRGWRLELIGGRILEVLDPES